MDYEKILQLGTKKLEYNTECIWTPGVLGLPKEVRVRIKGLINNFPVLGYGYIVEVLDTCLPNETYLYTHTIAYESSLVVEE